MTSDRIPAGYVDVREAARLVSGKPDVFNPGFSQWLERNPGIWHRFRNEADRIRRKRSHYSARTLVEFIRHETMLREDGGEFKVNNNAARDLARLYMATVPGAAGFFETREAK